MVSVMDRRPPAQARRRFEMTGELVELRLGYCKRLIACRLARAQSYKAHVV